MAIVVLDSDVLDSHPGITAYYVVGPITLKITCKQCHPQEL